MEKRIESITRIEPPYVYFRFTDEACERRIDVTPYADKPGEWMRHLFDPDYLKKASVAFDDWYIEWPEGQGICPCNLAEAEIVHEAPVS